MDDMDDNLEELDGIGAGYAKALNKIGIYRFADLLQFKTSEELQQALEDAGEKIPLWKITKFDWLGQARNKVLTQQVNTEYRPSQEAAEPRPEPQPLPPEEDWEQHAGFNLYFEFRADEHGQKEWRTHIYKSLDPDSFNGKEEFPGVEPGPWVDWILEQAELPEDAGPFLTETEVAAESAPAETEAAAPPTAVTPAAAGVEILDVQVSEIPPSADIPEKRLKVETRFQLSGTEAEKLAADRVPFRIEIHLVDLESGDSDLVASKKGPLQPEVFEYTSQQEFPIPEVGRYELHIILLLLPPDEMMTSHRGPTLKVVP